MARVRHPLEGVVFKRLSAPMIAKVEHQKSKTLFAPTMARLKHLSTYPRPHLGGGRVNPWALLENKQAKHTKHKKPREWLQ